MPEKTSVTVPLTARQKEQIKKMTGQTINALKVESAGGATLAKIALSKKLSSRALSRKMHPRALARAVAPRTLARAVAPRTLARAVAAKTIT